MMAQKSQKTTRAPYEIAKWFRPKGVCYCDLTDEECYNKGHWRMIHLKVEISIDDEFSNTSEVVVLYDLPADGLSRTLRISSVVERLMQQFPAYSAINVTITKDANDGKTLHRPPIGEQSA